MKIGFACLWFSWILTVFAVAAEPSDQVFFEKSLAPLITTRCAGCHNASDRKGGLDLTTREAMLAGGDSGAALSLDNIAESPLLKRVVDKEMPPKDPLSEAEQKIVQEWMRRSAPWHGGKLDPFQYTTKDRAGYDWWSLQPIHSVTLPAVNSSEERDWIRNPVDQFVAAKRHSAGVKPSAEADRRTLIRRLYFDLLGLPPTAREIEDFVTNASGDAYERLIDQLLASPAYGERWARHWLDVVRFGESQGFERDKLRSNSWRYRDWVINAWNDDLPYDQFALQQIAGDLIEQRDSLSTIATGFLVAAPYDEVGKKQQSAAMRAVVREDELEDLVGTIGQTFLGLTVNCARCHDHKFDPVKQAEYYRMSAAVAGVHHGEPALPSDPNPLETASRLSSVTANLKQLEQQLSAIESGPREKLLAKLHARRKELKPPKPVASWEFNEDPNDGIGNLHGELHNGARLEKGRLILDGKGFVTTAPLTSELKTKTLEAWVTITDPQQQGGGIIGVQTLDGSTFDSIVFGEREPRRWFPGSNSYERSQSFNGPEEQDTAGKLFHVAIVYREDGTVVGYRNGVRYGKEYQSNGPVSFQKEKSQVLFGLRHSPSGGNRLLRGSIDKARLYDRALNDEEIAASAAAEITDVAEEDLVAELSDVQKFQRSNLRFEMEQLRAQKTRLTDLTIYAVAPEKPHPTHVLARGNPGQKGELVSVGGIAAIRGAKSEFGLSTDSSDPERRLALAKWIASEHNGLFARVIVNRIWHYHFGVGIVDTPNDFGFNGGRPSHPEMLDWLAGELIGSGWSLKYLQRILLTSATYRQSSQMRPEAMQIDAGNRLLWRKSPQRIEAETLRDTLLAIAGDLDSSLHGPGFYDFKTYVSNSQFYELRDPVGTTFQRRSIYRTWVRSGRSPFLDVFDCPDPSTKAPQRAVTTTPLQALSLLNNSFVLRMADRWADQISKRIGPEPDAQIREAFHVAFGRQPDRTEIDHCRTLVQQHGLPALCRVLFNSNELLYVD